MDAYFAYDTYYVMKKYIKFKLHGIYEGDYMFTICLYFKSYAIKWERKCCFCFGTWQHAGVSKTGGIPWWGPH